MVSQSSPDNRKDVMYIKKAKGNRIAVKDEGLERQKNDKRRNSS